MRNQNLAPVGGFGPFSSSGGADVRVTNKWSYIIVVLVATATPLVANGSIVGFEALVLALASVPILVLAITHPRYRILWTTAGLWTFAQVLSNVFHGSVHFSTLMYVGLAAATISGGLYWVCFERKVDVGPVVVAFGLGWIALEVLFNDIADSANPWKYGLATPIAVTVLSLLWTLRANPFWTASALVTLAAVSFYFDSRLQTGIFLVCALALTVRNSGPDTRRTAVVTLVVLTATLSFMYAIYPKVAITGVLGQRAQIQQKIDEENGSNYLLATRRELPQMLYLTIAHPVLGYSSFKSLDYNQAMGALDFVDSHISPLSVRDQRYMTGGDERSVGIGYRPHSAALSSAVRAGLLALPFWIYIIILNIMAVVLFAKRKGIIPILMLYLGLLTSWDALFSPITDRTHLTIGLASFLIIAGCDLKNAQIIGVDKSATADDRRDAHTRSSKV